MYTLWKALALAASLGADAPDAQRIGTGSGRSSVTAPATKSAGVAAERAEMPATDPLILPRHGLLGAPGAALDAAGPSRLGAPSDRIAIVGEMPDSWRSGDRVRSASSADVRAARQQQAPDLEWASRHGTPTPAARAAKK